MTGTALGGAFCQRYYKLCPSRILKFAPIKDRVDHRNTAVNKSSQPRMPFPKAESGPIDSPPGFSRELFCDLAPNAPVAQSDRATAS
jgi:hypothetical protein